MDNRNCHVKMKVRGSKTWMLFLLELRSPMLQTSSDLFVLSDNFSDLRMMHWTELDDYSFLCCRWYVLKKIRIKNTLVKQQSPIRSCSILRRKWRKKACGLHRHKKRVHSSLCVCFYRTELNTWISATANWWSLLNSNVPEIFQKFQF